MAIIDDIIIRNSKLLANRDRDANKGSYGKLLVIGGSRGMAGAAYLCSLAAFRTGIGMVKVFGPECNRVILQTALPEAMYQSMELDTKPQDTETGFIASKLYDTKKLLNQQSQTQSQNQPKTQSQSQTQNHPQSQAQPKTQSQPGIRTIDEQALADCVDWADMLVIGPGLSKSDEAVKLMKLIGDDSIAEHIRDKELVLFDADALNIISGFMHEDANAKLREEASANEKTGNLSLSPLKCKSRNKCEGECRDESSAQPDEGHAGFTLQAEPDYGIKLLKLCPNIVITPHIGEMSRLTGLSIAYIKEHQLSVAEEFGRKYGITVVLKDAVTAVSIKHNNDKLTDSIISESDTISRSKLSTKQEQAISEVMSKTEETDGKTAAFTIDSGCGAMAKAGSGDVLCGFIAGITAVLKGNVSDSVPLAVYLHGRAGCMAAEDKGCHSILAEDIANCAGAVMSKAI